MKLCTLSAKLAWVSLLAGGVLSSAQGLAAGGVGSKCIAHYQELSKHERHVLQAEEVGLHYRPAREDAGITRKKIHGKFVFYYPNGKPVESERELERIRQLKLPPEYREVWISTDPDAHVQSVAKDARGRDQYSYHPKWLLAAEAEKFRRMAEFGSALGEVRTRVSEDLARKGLGERRVLAGLVRLLDKSHMRIGGERYLEENGTTGLTTLTSKQVTVKGDEVRLKFTGKAGVDHDIRIEDPALAKLLVELKKAGGARLFGVREEGGTFRSVSAERVNEYLKSSSQGEFTAKDFRTWAGTTGAARVLLERGAASTEAEAKKNIQAAIAFAASRLENTPAVSRDSYISPALLQAYERGDPIFKKFHVQAKRGQSNPDSLAEKLVLELAH